jgi:hypothetical protein
MNIGKYIRLTIGVYFLMVLPVNARAQTSTKTSLYPYFGFLDYGKTQAKSQASVTGIYGYYGRGANHSLEGDVSFMRIKYDYAGNASDYTVTQADMTLVYANYALSNWKIRGGMHGIVSDDVLTDKAYVLFAGVSRYKTYSYEAGVEVYASVYGNYTPDALHAVQVTATGGFYFGDFYKYGSFFARTRGHYIRLSDDVGFGEKSIGSIEQSLSYYRGPWTLEGYAWFGAQVFGVQNSGFVVKNLAEKHTGDVGGSVQYAFNDKWTAKLDASYGRFQELNQAGTSRLRRYLFMLGYTF